MQILHQVAYIVIELSDEPDNPTGRRLIVCGCCRQQCPMASSCDMRETPTQDSFSPLLLRENPVRIDSDTDTFNHTEQKVYLPQRLSNPIPMVQTFLSLHHDWRLVDTIDLPVLANPLPVPVHYVTVLYTCTLRFTQHRYRVKQIRQAQIAID